MAFVLRVGSSGRKFLYSSTSFSMASSCDCSLLRKLGRVLRMWFVSCWFSVRWRYGVPILSAMWLFHSHRHIRTVCWYYHQFHHHINTKNGYHRLVVWLCHLSSNSKLVSMSHELCSRVANIWWPCALTITWWSPWEPGWAPGYGQLGYAWTIAWDTTQCYIYIKLCYASQEIRLTDKKDGSRKTCVQLPWHAGYPSCPRYLSGSDLQLQCNLDIQSKHDFTPQNIL